MENSLKIKLIEQARKNGSKFGKKAELDFGAGAEWMYNELRGRRSSFTALVTYWVWVDSGHPMIDDYKETLTKVVDVENLIDINKLFINITKIKIL